LLAFCFSRKNSNAAIRGMAHGSQKAPEFPPVPLCYFSMSAFSQKSRPRWRRRGSRNA